MNGQTRFGHRSEALRGRPGSEGTWSFVMVTGTRWLPSSPLLVLGTGVDVSPVVC